MPSGIYKHKPRSKKTKEKIGKANKITMKKLWQNSEYRKHMSEVHKGQHSSPKTEFKKGQKPANFKGRIIKNTGYIYIFKSEHPYAMKDGYIAEHRLIAEKTLGRFLEPVETPHHLNEIKDDNRPENLFVFETDCKHKQFHSLLKNNPFLRTWFKSNLI